MERVWGVAIMALVLASCSKNQEPVTYYPPAGEIYAGETGRLVMPDDERVPVLMGRSVRDFKDGWAAYVAGREDLVRVLQKKGEIRWVPARTTVRVIITENILGEPFLFIRTSSSGRNQTGGLLEHASGWWTDARNFQITVGPSGSDPTGRTDTHPKGGLP
ncbi:MAG: hypothetical protein ACYC9S_09150 [Leptospirales bacterium]